MTLERFKQMDGKEFESFLNYIKQISEECHDVIKNKYFPDCTPSESWENDCDEVWGAIATLSSFAESHDWFREIINDFEL